MDRKTGSTAGPTCDTCKPSGSKDEAAANQNQDQNKGNKDGCVSDPNWILTLNCGMKVNCKKFFERGYCPNYGRHRLNGMKTTANDSCCECGKKK